MTRKQRAIYVLDEMEALFPDAKSELENWSTPFQFLIAIILSAQTTDKQVNKVTCELFRKYPTCVELMAAKQGDVEKVIGSVNYYRNKSKNIIATAKKIEDDFGGIVPKDVDDLVTLPGVGLKTANVFLNDMYEANQGIGADTHVMRVSQRLGFTKNTTPEKIAGDLEELYPREVWYKVTSLYVLYGRYYCKARVSPENSECVFKDFCSWCGGDVMRGCIV